MMIINYGVKIFLSETYITDETIGLYGNVLQWIVREDSFALVPGWACGILADDWCSGWQKSVQVDRYARPASIGGGSINIVNTADIWGVLQNLGIEIRGRRIQIFALYQYQYSEGIVEDVIYTGIVTDATHGRKYLELSFDDPSKMRDTALTKPNPADSEDFYPVTFGDIPKAKMVLIKNESEDISIAAPISSNFWDNYFPTSYAYKEFQKGYIFGIDTGFFSEAPDGTKTKLNPSEMIGKYVLVVHGAGKGQIRQIANASELNILPSGTISIIYLSTSFDYESEGVPSVQAENGDSPSLLKVITADIRFSADYDSSIIPNNAAPQISFLKEAAYIPVPVAGNPFVVNTDKTVTFFPSDATDLTSFDGYIVAPVAQLSGSTSNDAAGIDNSAPWYHYSTDATLQFRGGLVDMPTTTEPNSSQLLLAVDAKNDTVSTSAIDFNETGRDLDVLYQVKFKLPVFPVDPDEIFIVPNIGIKNIDTSYGFDGTTDIFVSAKHRNFQNIELGRVTTIYGPQSYIDNVAIVGANAFTLRDSELRASMIYRELVSKYIGAADILDGAIRNSAFFNMKQFSMAEIYQFCLKDFTTSEAQNASFIYLCAYMQYRHRIAAEIDLIDVYAVGKIGSADITKGIYSQVAGRKNDSDVLMSTARDVLRYVVSRQNFEADLLPIPSEGWGFGPATGADDQIKEDAAFGAFNWPSMPTVPVRRQILSGAQATTAKISEGLCRESWLISSIDDQGKECIFPLSLALNSFGDIAITQSNIIAESISPVDEITSDNIFAEISVQYEADFGTGKYKQKISITNVEKDIYDPSYITGLQSEDNAEKAKICWEMARSLYLRSRKKIEPPSSLTKLDWIYNEVDALQYLQNWYSWQGATSITAGYEYRPLRTIGFKIPLSFWLRNRIDVGTRISLNLTRETAGVATPAMAIMVKPSPKSNESTVSLKFVFRIPVGAVERTIYRETGTADLILRETGTADTIINEN